MAVRLRAPLVPLIVRFLAPVGVLLLVVIVRLEVQDGALADAGLKLPLEWGGNPVTLKLTLLEKPLVGVIVTVNWMLEPRWTVWGEGAEMLKSLTFWLTLWFTTFETWRYCCRRHCKWP